MNAAPYAPIASVPVYDMADLTVLTLTVGGVFEVEVTLGEQTVAMSAESAAVLVAALEQAVRRAQR